MNNARIGRSIFVLPVVLLVTGAFLVASEPAKEPKSYEAQRQAIYDLMPPQDLPRIKTVLDPKAVRIERRSFETENGKQSLASESSIWFCQGELFVRMKQLKKNALGEFGFNLVTSDGKLYLWKEGSQEGLILARFEADTVKYLFYVLDPSIIMASVYRNHHIEPDAFLKGKDKDLVVLTQKEPVGGAKITISYYENPCWFFSSKFVVEDRKIELLNEWDRPIEVETIPAEVKTLPTGVKFQDSKATLRTFMVYL